MKATQQASPERGSKFEAMLNDALPPRDHPRYECYRQTALQGVDSGEFILDLTSDHAAPHMDVLDVGCGNGGVAVACALRGHRVLAADMDAGSVARTLARAQAWGVTIDVLQSDASSLGLPAESFDMVVMNNIIEHVDDPDGALREAGRVLRPGGFAYIHAPQRWSPIGFLSDPHYGLFGVSVLPRSIGRWYVCTVRRLSPTYDMTTLPSTWGLRSMIARRGLVPLCRTHEYLARLAFARCQSSRPGSALLRLLSRHRALLRCLSPLMPSTTFLAFKPAADRSLRVAPVTLIGPGRN